MADTLCIIKDCNGVHEAKGYCNKHYLRLRLQGDPLATKWEYEEHGMSKTSEYHIWQGMKARCSKKAHKSYKDYGARGITVCDRWKSFTNFIEDMGKKPGAGYSIERLNFNGNYEPSNCVWATALEQARNTRNTERAVRYSYQNRTLTIREWAIEVGLKRQTLHMRLNKGWPIEKALTEKVG